MVLNIFNFLVHRGGVQPENLKHLREDLVPGFDVLRYLPPCRS